MLTKEPSVVQGAIAGGRSCPALKKSALIVLGCVYAAALIGYLLAYFYLSVGRTAVVVAAALLLLIFALVVNGLHHHGFERFGFANAVTAVRSALVSLVFGVISSPGAIQHAQATAWSLVVLVLVALSLDGVDGYLARRHGQESDLGARFDMEIDALLILCLSAAAFLLGKTGLWVLLIGLMRYGFLMAQFVVPSLRGSLPPSLRRKFVCVVQVTVLCLVLVPGIGSPVSSQVAAAALMLLSYSFTVDCLYLLSEAEADD